MPNWSVYAMVSCEVLETVSAATKEEATEKARELAKDESVHRPSSIDVLDVSMEPGSEDE